MEYNDGSESVEPGQDISIDGTDLGPATYDSDHDGVADSVIVLNSNDTVVVTDSDQDGRADAITHYDDAGEQTGHRSTGDSTDESDSPPGQAPAATSDNVSSGDQEPDIDNDSDDQGSAAAQDATDVDGRQPDDADGGAQPDADSADASPQLAQITVIDDQGRTVEVGEPTLDMDGDGTPDTTVVRNDDGSTTGYTDRNGDGEADQITRIGVDRSVTISVADGHGGWSVAVTGQLGDNGELLPSADDPADLVADVPAAVTDTEAAPVDAPAAAAGMTYTDAQGQSYQLGEPTADFDGDGVNDTVVTTLDDGTVVGYSDVDGDGQIDQVTQIDPDGTVTIGVPDGAGGWEQAATGRLGENGEFVPAEDAPAGASV